MLAVGALARLIGRFPVELVAAAVAKRSPGAFRELNAVALGRGWTMMDELLPVDSLKDVGTGVSLSRA